MDHQIDRNFAESIVNLVCGIVGTKDWMCVCACVYLCSFRHWEYKDAAQPEYLLWRSLRIYTVWLDQLYPSDFSSTNTVYVSSWISIHPCIHPSSIWIFPFVLEIILTKKRIEKVVYICKAKALRCKWVFGAYNKEMTVSHWLITMIGLCGES